MSNKLNEMNLPEVNERRAQSNCYNTTEEYFNYLLPKIWDVINRNFTFNNLEKFIEFKIPNPHIFKMNGFNLEEFLSMFKSFSYKIETAEFKDDIIISMYFSSENIKYLSEIVDKLNKY